MTLEAETINSSTNTKNVNKKEKQCTKVVMRRLPPQLNKETFLEQISPIPSYDYFYLENGDRGLGEFSFGRAYFNFVHPDDVLEFREKFDNYVFLDQSGHEYPAVVEFATFQKIPKKRLKNRMDPKCGTISTDQVYIDFVEQMNKVDEEVTGKPEFTMQLEKPVTVETTPLLEFVKNKRSQRFEERKRRQNARKKIKEERRSNEGKLHVPPNEEQSTTDNRFRIKENQASKSVDNTSNKSEKCTLPVKIVKSNDDMKKDQSNTKKREQFEKKSYKSYSRDNFKATSSSHQTSVQKETRTVQKRVKKYSEKREERKLESQKKLSIVSNSNQTKTEDCSNALDKNSSDSEVKLNSKSSSAQLSPQKAKNNNNKDKSKLNVEKVNISAEVSTSSTSNERDTEKRIRNKDRPTIAIYRPGMLSKKKHSEDESDVKNANKN